MNTNTNTTSKTTNSIFGLNMILLKTYIYEKVDSSHAVRQITDHNPKRYLTLFTFIPASEYKKEIKVLMDNHQKPYSTNTSGIFIKVVGSLSGLITTASRVPLSVYQKHLEDNGWNFVKTVPGTKGIDMEIARKMAWAEISKIKKEGEKQDTKQTILSCCDSLEEAYDCGGNITPHLDMIKNFVRNF